MNKLEKAKEVIMNLMEFGDCGIYNTRNIVGDRMTEIYNDGNLKIDICCSRSYFEVFGLNDNAFKELKKFYNANKGW